MKAWQQAWRMTVRDWRAGELTLMLAALVVAVASVTSVGFLADRLHLALQRDAAQLLGGDVVLVDSEPFDPSARAAAAARGLAAVDTVVFPSMVVAGNAATPQSQLASIKAVDDGYPLRGEVRLREPWRGQAELGTSATPGATSTPVAPPPEMQAAPVLFEGDPLAGYVAPGAPEPGTVWLDPRLLPLLGVAVGDWVELGERRLQVANVIAYEPDRGSNFVNLAPRVMLHWSDLDSTGLIAPGSRVTYRLLLAGESAAVDDFTQWVNANLDGLRRVETLASGRPEMQRTLERAQRFLSLVAMLAVLIATVAVALAARRYLLRHVAGVAVMRCLGATQRDITRAMTLEFLGVGLAGAALGAALGYAAHLGLLAALADLIRTELPAPSVIPALQGLLVGLWLLLGFALPSLARLRQVPPARVLRHDDDLPKGRWALGYAVGGLGFVALLMWVAGDPWLGGLTAFGFLLAFVLFAVLAWAALAALAPLRHWQRGSLAWRFAILGLVRRRGATVAQVCALSVGLMALLLLSITRTDLIEGWRMAAPPDAPNRFLINIQEDQVEPVRRFLVEAGLEVPLYPMVRGRLVAVNGTAVSTDDFEDRQARRFVDRESNLSYAAELPANNREVAGRWFAADDLAVSMDADLARQLRLQLGDRLTWEVAGRQFDVNLVHTRDPQWDSMSVNFFVVMSPAALAEAPATWLSSFHVPAGRPDPLPALVALFPNLSVFDISAILAQVQQVLDQVIVAVQGLFVFTLLAGVLVLYAALATTRDERVREAALLRSLGATRQQLARTQWLELSLLGSVAGLLAASAAAALAWVLAEQVFEFAFVPGPWIWISGWLAGIVAALAGGQAGLRGVLRTPPMQTLRAAEA